MKKAQVGWSPWYIVTEGGALAVKRYRLKGGRYTWQRLPKRQYKEMTRAQVEQLVLQLNIRHTRERERVEAAYRFKHAFISQELVDNFIETLRAEIPSTKFANNLAAWLQRCCLHWFINQLGKVDPLEWKKSEHLWGQALTCSLSGRAAEGLRIWDEKVHPDTIKKVIGVANRFLLYLHNTHPSEVPRIELVPVTKAVMKMYRAEYLQGGEYEPGRYIEDQDWSVILKELNREILPFVQLAYDYGLRRTESMAAASEGLFEDHLEISRQLRSAVDGKPGYGPLKNRKPREVPHWFADPEKTYHILEAGLPIMHPDTFSKKFAAEMARLDMDYSLHDLRRTFITRAFRAGINPRDIQLAVGHADLRTTLQYAQDDRGLKKRRFVPKAG